jgi:hypothetical protein
VRTLRSAALALTDARSPDALKALAAALGFTAPAHRLDAEGCRVLGLDAPGSTVSVVRGRGRLRALLVAIGPGSPPIRDAIARIARGLGHHAPHLEWLAVVAEQDGRHVALATWSVERAPPRTAALIVDRTHVRDSDAETLRALCGAFGAEDEGGGAMHDRWLRILGRDGLSSRFYRALEGSVSHLATTLAVPAASVRIGEADRRALAVLHASRLLFLAFLEAKGWLDGDPAFLARTFARCVGGAGDYHRRVLRPLFFGTLNTPPAKRAPAARTFGRIPFLNGGLFAPTPLERRHGAAHFPDAAIGHLFGTCFERYRFTAREDGRAWTEAAIDPEMLGRAFESLMDARSRRATGAFYTPQVLVDHVTESALVHTLGDARTADAVRALLRGEGAPERIARSVRSRVATLRILDPACGSGALLVRALEVLSDVLARTGDPRPLSAIRRDVLTRSIFGVDVNPTAAWLCELRLWLSVVIDSEESDPTRVTPLPNLDRNIRIGDALSGTAFDDAPFGCDPGAERAGRSIAMLRVRYAGASGIRKQALARALEKAERTQAIAVGRRGLVRLAGERREALIACRSPDLFGTAAPVPRATKARLRELRRQARELRMRVRDLASGAALPFGFGTGFADAAADGGFDAVLGNPPWVRPHALPASLRSRLRESFRVARDAAWARGAAAARAGTGFGGQVDLAALFVERGLSLCRTGGVLAFLLPAKLWRSLAGGGVRCLLAGECHLLALEDWSGAARTFDAAVYPSLLVGRRAIRTGPSPASPHVHSWVGEPDHGAADRPPILAPLAPLAPLAAADSRRPPRRPGAPLVDARARAAAGRVGWQSLAHGAATRAGDLRHTRRSGHPPRRQSVPRPTARREMRLQ